MADQDPTKIDYAATSIRQAVHIALVSGILDWPNAGFWNGLILLTILGTWWAAAFFGYAPADKFWGSYSASVITLFGASLGASLTYHGARFIMGTPEQRALIPPAAAPTNISNIAGSANVSDGSVKP